MHPLDKNRLPRVKSFTSMGPDVMTILLKTRNLYANQKIKCSQKDQVFASLSKSVLVNLTYLTSYDCKN